MKQKLAVIGGGKMGSAIVRGLISDGFLNSTDICIVERDEQRRQVLATHLGSGVLLAATVPPADFYLLATKPQDVAQAVKAVVEVNEEGILISIAAGVTLDTLHRFASPASICIRVMPNSPATIGQGLSAICCDDNTPQSVLEFVSHLFNAVGDVIFIDESKMNLITAVSGSGPAYIYLFAEALEDATVALGLSHEMAKRIVQKTFVGASQMYAIDEEDLRTLRRNVTSPGGTTAAGTMELERYALRRAVFDAVEAASKRADEVGSSENH